jgi:hypothetical protein
VVLENLQPFLGTEAKHPLDERRIDVSTIGFAVVSSVLSAR